MPRGADSIASSFSSSSACGHSAASKASGASTSSKTDRRLAEAMERLLAQPPASPPIAEYRPREKASPPLPSTLRELYDARFEVQHVILAP